MKKEALDHCVHLNNHKIYLPRLTAAAKDVEMVDILESEQQATGEHMVEVYGMDGTGGSAKAYLE